MITDFSMSKKGIMMENILTDFESQNCCGCLACVETCPFGALHPSRDKYGFTIPAVDDTLCIGCGKCMQVCPYHNSFSSNKKPKTFAAVHRDDAVVLNSSSGGVFTALAEAVLSEGGVVYGATMDADFLIHHIRIGNIEAVDKLRKSKYVQSSMIDVFQPIKEDLDRNIPVLFAGTPCQVASILSYVGENKPKLITVDVVCHGVPNQQLFSDYLKCLEEKEGKIHSYGFRSKQHRYDGMTWYSSYTSDRGKRTFNWPEDSYNYLYMKGLIYRDSCYTCPFSKKERISDITLCDFWGWSNFHSDVFKSGEAVSGIIVSTDHGEKLINSLQDKLILVESRYEDLLQHNKSIYTHENSEAQNKRIQVLDDWTNNGYQYVDKIFKKKHMKQILKYKLLRSLPFSFRKLI
jgi:coenzyme F420-reducing hydrogenase beta subunit